MLPFFMYACKLLADTEANSSYRRTEEPGYKKHTQLLHPEKRCCKTRLARRSDPPLEHLGRLSGSLAQ